MILEMMKAFVLILFAEMGDKTQVLAMAFSSRFPTRKVLLGIAIGSLFNHALAVILGNALSRVIPMTFLQIIAGFAFVGFAIWTLRIEEEEEIQEEKIRFGPVVTVALAFFLGELGDKTQLSAITLAADAQYPLMILLGTVSGMVVIGAIAILIFKKVGNKISELTIKVSSAIVFLIFGLQKLTQYLPKEGLHRQLVLLLLATMVFVILWLLKKLTSYEKNKVKKIK